MWDFIIKTLIFSISIFLTARVLDGVKIKDYTTSIVAAIVLVIANMVLAPILHLVSIPITILTLGLFAFIINALIIYLVSKFVDGFEIENFGWAIIFAVVQSVINALLQWIF